MATSSKSSKRRAWRSVVALAAVAAALPFGAASTASAGQYYGYQQTIQFPTATATNKFSGYDLATFDPTNQLYYLTDRSFNGIDVFSAKTNSFVTQIGTGLFAGTAGGNNDIAGPNGISLTNTPTGKLLVAGNGLNNLLTFSLNSTGTALAAGTIPRLTSVAVPGLTPTPANRVDGVAYAPGPNTILAANNASNPGFLTLINNADGSIKQTILLNGAGGNPNVGGFGVEATVYNTARGTFFVAVPSLSASTDANGNPINAGGVIEVDATTGQIKNVYDFGKLGLTGPCSPTGLSQGAGAAVFVACSDPAAGHSILLDPAGTGTITTVNGISGGDQTAYDPALNTFYEAARFQTGGPVLGVIDANSLALQLFPIGSNDHSVAVDPVSGEVFVATGATTAFPGCTNGCIGVFAPVPEPGTLPVLAVALAGLGWVVRRRVR